MSLTDIALIGVAVIAILGAAGAFTVAYRRSQSAEPDPTAGVSSETMAADRSMDGVEVEPTPEPVDDEVTDEPEPEVSDEEVEEPVPQPV